jgi:hypothetical protein
VGEGMRKWTRGRPVRLVVLAGLLGLVLSANAMTTAGANGRFPEKGYSPTSGIQPQVVHNIGEVFFAADLLHFDHTGTGTIVLAGNQDGTGSTLVDDKILVKVRRPDGTTAIYQHDYSRGCTGSFPLGPVDITSLFKTGTNRVEVTLKDMCGGEEASNAIWITAAP